MNPSPDISEGDRDHSLRVLFLSQYFYPEQFSNNGIATELVARGHRVTAIPCVPNYPEGQFYDGYGNFRKRAETWEGVDIRRAWTVARGRTKVQLIANYLTYPLAALWEIIKLHRPKGDVSFVSMPSPLLQAFAGVLAKRLWGIPTVYWVQDLWPETVQQLLGLHDGPFLKLLDKVCGWLYRQADLILVQSAAMPDNLARHGVDPRRIRVLPNTAPPFFRPLPLESIRDVAVEIDRDRFIVLFAGNIGESQGLDVLVEVAGQLGYDDDTLFVLVGDGRARADLEREIAARGLTDRFHFCGRHPEALMPHFFAQADALFASLREAPNFSVIVPYKIQTYMACGKPIIAALDGEGARIIEHSGAGVTSPPGDARGVVNSIRALRLMGSAERMRMGERARLYFEENFSNRVIFDTVEQALRDAKAISQ